MFTLNNWLIVYYYLYPAELQLHKANSSDTEASFYDYPKISTGTVNTKICDKRGDFDLLVSRCLMAMSLSKPLMEYIRFAKASSHVSDAVNFRNKALTAKLLKHKLRPWRFQIIANTMNWCAWRTLCTIGTKIRLISAFIVRCLGSIKSLDSIAESSRL